MNRSAAVALCAGLVLASLCAAAPSSRRAVNPAEVHRVKSELAEIEDVFERYTYMVAIQADDLELFYAVVLDDPNTLVPLLYTPGVGTACWDYGRIPKTPPFLTLSIEADKGHVAERLAAYDDVSVIVVTDGERILGLGDLGVWGAGIPVGKLTLYTALAGIDPYTTLPVVIDVGTNTDRLLDDPVYGGIRKHRVEGAAYDAFLDEFVMAVKDRFPSALLQFEDFGKHNAFPLLERYKDVLPTFNDDIMGTASVVVAGLIAAGRPDKTTTKHLEGKYLFYGAGQAAVGIADLIVAGRREFDLERDQAALESDIILVDSRGLVYEGRPGRKLAPHKRKYARPLESYGLGAGVAPASLSLEDLVKAIKPTALIGVSTRPGTFTPGVLRAMADLNERPIIMALSNPTSKSECTAEEAYTHTDNRAWFASGSPFPDYVDSSTGVVKKPRQANNCFIFPGIGLGVQLAGATRVTEQMMLHAAMALAHSVTDDDLAVGSLYPTMAEAREALITVARTAGQVAMAQGNALKTYPAKANLDKQTRRLMYSPNIAAHDEL